MKPAKFDLFVIQLAALAAFLLNLSGCLSVGPDFSPPSSKLQTDWHDAPSLPSAVSAESFWSSFHDATLLQLIALANKNNPGVASAAQAIEQAEAVLHIDQGNRLPSASLNGSSQYQQPTISSELLGKNNGATTRQLLGQLNWELDFWGKYRRAVEADRASVAVAQSALAAARTSLEASVASTYSTVRMLEKRIEVARQNLTEQAENLRIAQARYRLGATSELDFRQSQTQFEQTNAQLPVLQIGLEQSQHALSILLGETPDYFVKNFPAGTGMPAFPTMLPLGAPSDLLRRRPDVLQTEYAAAAQSARIGVAKAALYPSFTLNGAIGYSSTDGISNLFKWDNRAVAYGIGFNLPLFDRERISGQVKVQDSLFTQAVLAYQNQVLKAQQEVEDALSAIAGNSLQLANLQQADKAAARTSLLAQLRYRAGQVDYTTVSSAVQAHLQTSDSTVQAEGSVLQAYISAFRALGGGWDPLNSNANANANAMVNLNFGQTN